MTKLDACCFKREERRHLSRISSRKTLFSFCKHILIRSQLAFESEELSSYECNLGASQGFIICSLSRFETLDYHGHIQLWFDTVWSNGGWRHVWSCSWLSKQLSWRGAISFHFFCSCQAGVNSGDKCPDPVLRGIGGVVVNGGSCCSIGLLFNYVAERLP